ncbi:hypothetical protein JOD57_003592 [Geodermatophilus bullaregiensis]|nr:hypothetical protein [Geodermatophilus bullaregiensis]
MPISFHAGDELPPTVIAVPAQHPDRTVVLLNHTLVELMSPHERMELLNALFARMDEPPTGGRFDELDELAAPRRERSRRNRREQPICRAQHVGANRLPRLN